MPGVTAHMRGVTITAPGQTATDPGKMPVAAACLPRLPVNGRLTRSEIDLRAASVAAAAWDGVVSVAHARRVTRPAAIPAAARTTDAGAQPRRLFGLAFESRPPPALA
jgi:hypothetical protein